ncbi:hypothetical protein CJF32_00000971 [Rutstroemia sp. NJR-2017a WRK4]|nr:hypothetical protein CJF32_00000971 [Rutstroemia sp. NJR-2017a WRK4]
MKSFIWKRRRL